MGILTGTGPGLRARVRAAVTAGVMVLVSAGLAAGSALAPAAASAKPVIYGLPAGNTGSNFVNATVKPGGELIFTGDGSAWLKFRSWSSWGATSARGKVVVHVRSCWASCFKFKRERGAIRAFRVRSHNGQPYFTRLRFYLRHKVAGLGSTTLCFEKQGSPAWVMC